MDDDAALLHAYAEEGAEHAFTELVRRHVDLVYAAALRRVNGDAHLAADIAQQVFATLARQANRAWRPRVLSAWLHTATRNAAANTMTSEKRRRLREQAARDPALAATEAAPEWTQLRPVLDAAIDELPEADRAAVVLRFLERRAFGEIGTKLEISADAARMRTERALDKLRAALAKRGITSTAAAVGAIVSSQAAVSAPAGLVASIAASSLATAGAGAGALAIGVASFMNLKTVVAGVAVLGAFLGGTYIGLMQQLDAPPLPAPETLKHSQTIADLRRENLALRAEVEQLKAANARLDAPHPTPSASPVALAHMPIPAASSDATAAANRQRAVLNNLRQISGLRDQFRLEQGRLPNSIAELFSKYTTRFSAVAGEDYASISLVPGQPMTVATPDGPVTLQPSSAELARARGQPIPPRVLALQQRILDPMQKAVQAYRAATGKSPSETLQTLSGSKTLIPYFASPQAGADYVEYLEALNQAGLIPP